MLLYEAHTYMHVCIAYNTHELQEKEEEIRIA